MLVTNMVLHSIQVNETNTFTHKPCLFGDYQKLGSIISFNVLSCQVISFTTVAWNLIRVFVTISMDPTRFHATLI